jgi:hypothetical protein
MSTKAWAGQAVETFLAVRRLNRMEPVPYSKGARPPGWTPSVQDHEIAQNHAVLDEHLALAPTADDLDTLSDIRIEGSG